MFHVYPDEVHATFRRKFCHNGVEGGYDHAIRRPSGSHRLAEFYQIIDFHALFSIKKFSNTGLMQKNCWRNAVGTGGRILFVRCGQSGKGNGLREI
jgi:hypothetical protein